MQFFPLRPVMAAALMLAGLQAHAKSEPVDEPPATTETPAQASAWKVFEGQSYRVEADGNFSCYSEDGQHCKPGTPSDDETLVKPLTCGPGHAARYDGATGYDQPNHWCNVAYANLFAKWQDYEMLGFRLLLSKTPNNDTMCMSSDGTNCEWGQQKGEPAPGRLIAPVVCGKALLGTQWQITGYEPERADHWCQSPEIVMSEATRPPVRTELPDGDVIYWFGLPDEAAHDSAEFFIQSKVPTSRRPIITVADHERVVASTFAAQAFPESTIAFRFLRVDGELRAFMTGEVEPGFWSRADVLRKKLQQGNPRQAWALRDVWDAANFWKWQDWETDQGKNTIEVRYAQAPGFNDVPRFMMTLPRKKPRY